MNAASTQGTPLRVLIADDARETRESTQLMMRLVPNAQIIAVAEDGQEAIDLAQQHRPNVAIMDINMPKRDGLDAIQVIRQTLPDLVCIVISAEKDRPTLQKAVKIGVQAYLIKPFTAKQLTAVMEKARALVAKIPQSTGTATDTAQARRQTLERLARGYAKAHRTDDRAIQVFEALAADPECAQRWLMILAMMYVVRQEWRKLRKLVLRLEQMKTH